jgi:hypothetical protein
MSARAALDHQRREIILANRSPGFTSLELGIDLRFGLSA